MISEKIREAVIKRRGRLRVFSDIDPRKAALLVIDMQNCFCAPGGAIEVPKARSLVPNINRLAQVSRQCGAPVFWIRHVNKKDGSDWRLFFDGGFLSEAKREVILGDLREGSPGTQLWMELDAQPGDYHLEKCRYSALIPGSSNLERALRSLGRDTLMITGVRTNICPESTARDAMMLDFKVFFIGDGTAAMTDEEHQATLNTLIQSFADVVTTTEMIAEIENAAPKLEVRA